MPQQLFNSTVHCMVYGKLKPYILNNSGKTEDADDILQEGWLVLFKKGRQNEFDDERKLASYLLKTCINLWKRELRDRKGQVLSDTFDDFEDDLYKKIEEDEKKEVLLRVVMRCLEKLSKRCQEVFRMKMEGCTCEEIATQLELDNSQVSRNKTYTCKKRLQELVQLDPEYICVFGNEKINFNTDRFQ